MPCVWQRPCGNTAEPFKKVCVMNRRTSFGKFRITGNPPQNKSESFTKMTMDTLCKTSIHSLFIHLNGYITAMRKHTGTVPLCLRIACVPLGHTEKDSPSVFRKNTEGLSLRVALMRLYLSEFSDNVPLSLSPWDTDGSERRSSAVGPEPSSTSSFTFDTLTAGSFSPVLVFGCLPE